MIYRFIINVIDPCDMTPDDIAKQIAGLLDSHLTAEIQFDKEITD